MLGHSRSAVVEFVQGCWREPERVKEVNATIVALIPKIPRPTTIQQYRPISLCNVAYKVIMKCLAEKLKPLMTQLVHETQTSFVSWRQITDKISILREVVHSMRAKTGKVGWMTLKIDLAKAYDRIKWSFVRDTLVAAKVPQDFIELTMSCITTASMQIQWNGGLTKEFRPSRGLHQGCPLSLYIFTLCMECLGQLVEAAVARGDWKPIRLSQRGPLLSHLFFADDLIFFGVSSMEQVQVISQCLQEFGAASG
ncbi:unnamed protein product [Linum trigynum]|uniref:Reverse transcriptase domain-containing protein n=1 Tax=Linum trigynum TaxID=586398 RepID=A0AAV2FRV6_9ROSI